METRPTEYKKSNELLVTGNVYFQQLTNAITHGNIALATDLLRDSRDHLIAELNEQAKRGELDPTVYFNLCLVLANQSARKANYYIPRAYQTFIQHKIKINNDLDNPMLQDLLLYAIRQFDENKKDTDKNAILNLLNQGVDLSDHGAQRALYDFNKSTKFFEELEQNKLEPKIKFDISMMLGRVALRKKNESDSDRYFFEASQIAKNKNNGIQLNDSQQKFFRAIAHVKYTTRESAQEEKEEDIRTRTLSYLSRFVYLLRVAAEAGSQEAFDYLKAYADLKKPYLPTMLASYFIVEISRNTDLFSNLTKKYSSFEIHRYKHFIDGEGHQDFFKGIEILYGFGDKKANASGAIPIFCKTINKEVFWKQDRDIRNLALFMLLEALYLKMHDTINLDQKERDEERDKIFNNIIRIHKNILKEYSSIGYEMIFERFEGNNLFPLILTQCNADQRILLMDIIMQYCLKRIKHHRELSSETVERQFKSFLSLPEIGNDLKLRSYAEKVLAIYSTGKREACEATIACFRRAMQLAFQAQDIEKISDVTEQVKAFERYSVLHSVKNKMKTIIDDGNSAIRHLEPPTQIKSMGGIDKTYMAFLKLRKDNSVRRAIYSCARLSLLALGKVLSKKQQALVNEARIFINSCKDNEKGEHQPFAVWCDDLITKAEAKGSVVKDPDGLILQTCASNSWHNDFKKEDISSIRKDVRSSMRDIFSLSEQDLDKMLEQCNKFLEIKSRYDNALDTLPEIQDDLRAQYYHAKRALSVSPQDEKKVKEACEAAIRFIRVNYPNHRFAKEQYDAALYAASKIEEINQENKSKTMIACLKRAMQLALQVQDMVGISGVIQHANKLQQDSEAKKISSDGHSAIECLKSSREMDASITYKIFNQLLEGRNVFSFPIRRPLCLCTRMLLLGTGKAWLNDEARDFINKNENDEHKLFARWCNYVIKKAAGAVVKNPEEFMLETCMSDDWIAELNKFSGKELTEKEVLSFRKEIKESVQSMLDGLRSDEDFSEVQAKYKKFFEIQSRYDNPFGILDGKQEQKDAVVAVVAAASQSMYSSATPPPPSSEIPLQVSDEKDIPSSSFARVDIGIELMLVSNFHKNTLLPSSEPASSSARPPVNSNP